MAPVSSVGRGVQRCVALGVAVRPCGVWSAVGEAGALQRGVRGGGEVLDVVGGALRLGGCVHQQGRVMAQHAHPALEIGRTVLEGGVGNAAHAAEIRGPHFRDELFFGVGGIAEATGGRERGAVEPRGVPNCVD